MSSPSRFNSRIAGKLLAISALISILFVVGCTASGPTIGPPAKVAFTVQPGTAGAGSATVTVSVSVEDANGNVVPSATNPITLAIGTGTGTLSGTLTQTPTNGVAVFSGLTISSAGRSYTLTASAVGLTGATSNTFIVYGAATQVVFTQQPSNVAAGSSITPAVTASIEDALGSVVANSTSQVTIAIGTNPSSGTLSGTVSVNAIAGVATFSTLSFNKVGTGYTLTATSGALTVATSGAFNVTPGAPAKLVFSQQPTNVTAGSPITPAVTVTVQDALGNMATSANNQVTLAIGTNPANGTLGGTLSAPAAGGMATFSNLTINFVGTGYTLTASSGALTAATSFGFNVTVGAPAKLAFVQQPSTVVAGVSIAPAVTVSIEDAQGNVETTLASLVSMAIQANPGSGTLGGITSVAAAAGVATFSSLSINKTGTGYTLTASSGVLTAATSSAFNVTPGAATQVVFVQQPTNVTAGSSITPAVTVNVEDALGNVATSYVSAVSIAILTNPSSGTLGGTTSVNAAAGVATFSNLSVNLVGAGYTLTASSGALSTATSSAFNVTPGAAAKLAFVQQPTTVVAGVSIAPAVTVSIEDAQGNLVTSATTTVSLAIQTNPGSTTLVGTSSVGAVAGVATFPGLSINIAGTGYTLQATDALLTSATSNPFNVTAAAAAKLAFTQQPTNVAAGSPITPAVAVSIEDVFGNVVTSASGSVAIAIQTNPVGGTLGGTTSVSAVAGVATFSGLNINLVGTGYTLTAAFGAFTSPPSNPFNVTAGAPAKLVFVQQPTNVAAGSAIAPAVTVNIEDVQGNLVTSATTSVSMVIQSNPSSGILGGTTSVNAVAGVATFSSLNINLVGTGYTLTASDGALTPATSTPFNVTPGAAAKLVFAQQPTTTVAGSPITPAMTVNIEDAQGNVVTSANSTMVSVAIQSNPGNGALSGTTSVTSVSGVATFPGLSINLTGNGYVLQASAASLTSGNSAPFNITPGAASKLAFTSEPVNDVTGIPIAPVFQVSVEDALGNVVTSANNTITIAIGTNPVNGTLGGTLSAAAANGVATFTNVSISGVGNGYTLTAASGTLTGATSALFNVIVSVGPPAKLAFTTEPTNVVAGSSIAPAVQVAIEDSNGNVVTGNTTTVTISIGTNPAGGTLGGTLSVVAVSGVATFSNLSINKATNGYTLQAADGALTPANSTSFNVAPGSASQLVFTQQPTNVVAGSFITPAVQVSVEDSNGNVVISNTSMVVVAIQTNPSSGTLAGSISVSAISGVATFSNLSINLVGNGYTLKATDGALTAATGSAFNVTVGSPAKLAFSQQPTNVGAGSSISPAVTVSIEDAQGNVVTSATSTVVMAIQTNPGSATLNGTSSVAATSGVATFSNLSINSIANGYTLTATDGALTAAVSNTFNVTLGAPAQLAFTQQPTSAVDGASIAPSITVSIEDAGGNVVTSAASTVTLAIQTNPGSGTLSGTASVAAASGVATFSNLSINFVGTGYTLKATDGALTSATSTAFNVTIGASTKLAFTQQPTNVTAGSVISPAVTVSIEDANGNVETAATSMVTIAILNNAGSGTLSGTLSTAAAAGVATFSNLSINNPGNGYTLQATDGAFTAANSNSFNVAATCTTNCSISGTVTGAWVSGVMITIVGPSPSTTSTSTTTAANGTYSFTNLNQGTYSVTPSLAGYNFAPTSVPSVSIGASTTENFSDTSASAQASYSISGTVSYSGTQNANFTTYISVYQTNCGNCGVVGGTTIHGTPASTGTSYTIRGLPQTFSGNQYFVRAEIDTFSTGTPNAADPAGNTATFTLTSNLTGENVALTAQTVPSAQIPSTPAVFPSNGAAFASYNGPTDSNGDEIATSYNLYYGTSSGSLTSHVSIPAGNPNGVYILSGLTNSTQYYFALSAVNVNGESSKSSVYGPVTIGATAGSNTISGTITFTGTPNANAPLYIGVFSQTLGVYFERIAPPFSSGVAYSVAGIPSGNYQFFAVLDQNNNGFIDTGDITNFTGSNGPPLIPVNGTLTGHTISLGAVSGAGVIAATSFVTTNSSTSSGGTGYGINVGTNLAAKLPVSMTVFSGPNVVVPFDTTTFPNNGGGNPIFSNSATPLVGDTYQFLVTFSDGSTQVLSSSVTAVLNPPQNLTINSPVTGTAIAPVFNWTAPSPAPAALPYTYSVQLNGGTENENWQYPNHGSSNGLPSTTLNVTFNTDGKASPNASLMAGNTYNWDVQVTDANGNQAQYQTTYTVPGGFGPAAKLAFTTQPSNTTANVTISPSVQVAIEDASGNIVTSANSSVTIAIGTNAGGGSLGGTLTVGVSNGVATFSNLTISNPGTGYTLAATDGALTGATSNLFNVAGAVAKLVFKVEPSNVPANSSIAPAVQVAFEDTNNNVVTNQTGTITIGFGTNAGPGATLSGTTNVAAVNGVSTFSNLSINLTGTGYTLQASTGVLLPVTSTSFNVVVGVPSVTITSVPFPIFSGAVAQTITITVTNDLAGDNLTPTLTTSAGGACTTATCGSIGSVNLVSLGNYTLSYTPPSTLSASIFPTLNVSSSLANSFAATTSLEADPAGAVLLTLGGVGQLVQVSSPAKNKSATVFNDVGNAGVTLSLLASGYACPSNGSGGTICGTLTVGAQTNVGTTSTIPYTYTPPTSIPAAPYDRPMILAISKADNSQLSAVKFEISATVPSNPFIPTNFRLNTALTGGAGITVSANLNGDSGNSKTVNWTLMAGGSNCSTLCGALGSPAYIYNGTAVTATITYTPPASVPVGADANPTITVTSVDNSALSDNITFQIVDGTCGTGNNGILTGQYAFLVKGGGATVGYSVSMGSFTADGNGNITGGSLDINRTTGSAPGLSILQAGSSYSIGSDNRGCLTLANSNGGSATYRIAVGATGAGQQGRMILYVDETGNGQRTQGFLKKQDPTSFSTAAVVGNFAFGHDGITGTGGRFALAGVAHADGLGNITNIDIDTDSNGVLDTNDTSSSGSTYEIDSSTGSANGRGKFIYNSATSGTFNFVTYAVSASDFLLMSTDPLGPNNVIQSGEHIKQTVASFTGNELNGSGYVVTASTIDTGNGGDDITIGQAQAGTLSGGTVPVTLTLDENDNGVLNGNNGGVEQTGTGAFTIGANGRATITGIGNHAPVFYLIGPSGGFIVGTDTSGAVSGVLEQQTGEAGGGFSTAQFSGLYSLGGGAPTTGGTYDVGSVTFNNVADTATGNDNSSGPPSQGGLQVSVIPENGSSAYSFSTSSTPIGRGNLGSNSIGYAVSPSEIIFLTTSSGNPPELFYLRK